MDKYFYYSQLHFIAEKKNHQRVPIYNAEIHGLIILNLWWE